MSGFKRILRRRVVRRSRGKHRVDSDRIREKRFEDLIRWQIEARPTRGSIAVRTEVCRRHVE